MVRISEPLIERARRKAKQSQCRMQIAALGFNKAGVCVATATNKFRYIKKGGGIHAEEQVMRNAHKTGVVKILICRVSRGGNFLPIDPCSKCSFLSEKLGIPITTIPAEK